MFKKNTLAIQYRQADLVFLLKLTAQGKLSEVLNPRARGFRPFDTLLDLNVYSLPACRNLPEVSAGSGSTSLGSYFRIDLLYKYEIYAS